MDKYQQALDYLATQTDREVIHQDEINGHVSTLQELVDKVTPKIIKVDALLNPECPNK